MPKLGCEICGQEKEVPKCCDKSMIIRDELLCCCEKQHCGYMEIPLCCGKTMTYLG